MLDEKALRREGFRGGAGVVLADGQEWVIPRPRTLWIADDSEVGARLGYDLGVEYDELARKVEEAVTIGDAAPSVFRAAKHLLRLNYSLDEAAIIEILRADFSPKRGDETDAQRIARQLTEVILGADVSDRPSPDG